MNLPQVLQHHSSEGRQQIDDGLQWVSGVHHVCIIDLNWIVCMLWDHMYVYVHTKSHIHMYTYKVRIIHNIVPRYLRTHTKDTAMIGLKERPKK